MNTSNLRTVCYIIASINYNITQNKLKFQIYDKELNETIASIFRLQNLDNTLKKFHNLLGKSLSETFDTIFKRNPTWGRYIEKTIEAISLPKESTNLKDVLFVYKRSPNIKSYIYENKYKLISSFSERKVFCLFDEIWYDCSSSIELPIKEIPDFTFPTTLVYLKVNKTWIPNNIEIASEQSRRMQKLASDIKPNEIVRRNVSADTIASTPKNLSNSPKSSLKEENHKSLNIIPELSEKARYNKEDWTEIPRDNKFRDREYSKIADSDDKTIYPNIKILNERCLVDLETRLIKLFEEKLQKSLEIYKREESLKYQKANKSKEDLFKFTELQQALQSLDGKFKEFNLKLEKLDASKNNIDPESIIKETEARVSDGLKAVLYQRDKRLYQEIKSIKDSKISSSSIDLEILKTEILKEINKTTKNKFTELENHISKEVRDLNEKYNILESKISNKDSSIENIKYELKDIGQKIQSLPNKWEVNSLKDKINSWNNDRESSLRDWESLKAQINSLAASILDNKKLKDELDNANYKILQLENIMNKRSPESSIEINDYQIVQSSKSLTGNQSKAQSLELLEKNYQPRNNLYYINNKDRQFENQRMRMHSPESQTYISDSRNIPIEELSPTTRLRSLPQKPLKEFPSTLQIKNEQPYINTQKNYNIHQKNIYSKSGLPNIENTCYMNSLIQIFASATEFVEYIKNCSSNKLFWKLSQIIELMQSNSEEDNIRPLLKELKNIVSEEYSMYNGFSENDAKELFVIISDKIENQDLFTVVKKQSFTCKSYFRHKTYYEDRSNLLIIPINKQNDIENFFKDIKEWKIYSGENQLNCTDCGSLRDTIMSTESIQWPNILAIYMPDYKSSKEISDSFKIENYFYSIFGVICYYGNHFMAFTKNDENEWEKYNDSNVSKTDPDWNRLYLAFYKKINIKC